MHYQRILDKKVSFFVSVYTRGKFNSHRIDILACRFCFPISGNVMVPQRNASLICCPLHVHPRAYVCIIYEKTKG